MTDQEANKILDQLANKEISEYIVEKEDFEVFSKSLPSFGVYVVVFYHL